MPNPFDFIHEIREANAEIVSRLDQIVELLKEIRDNTARIPDDPF